jgi:hypothetical protein
MNLHKFIFKSNEPEDLFKKFKSRRVGWFDLETNSFRALFTIGALKDGSIFITGEKYVVAKSWFGFSAIIPGKGKAKLSDTIKRSIEVTEGPKIDYHRSGEVWISRTGSSSNAKFSTLRPLNNFWRNQIFAISNFRADILPTTAPKRGDIVLFTSGSGPMLIQTRVYIVDNRRLLGNRSYHQNSDLGGGFMNDGLEEVLVFPLLLHGLSKTIGFEFVKDLGDFQSKVLQPEIQLFAFNRKLIGKSKLIGLVSTKELPKAISTSYKRDFPFPKFFVFNRKTRDIKTVERAFELSD